MKIIFEFIYVDRYSEKVFQNSVYIVDKNLNEIKNK